MIGFRRPHRKRSELVWVFVSITFLVGSSVLPAKANQRCYRNPEPVAILVAPPTNPLAFLISFEAATSLAFPVGSPMARLTNWLDKMHFSRQGRAYMDSTFVGEPDELARFRSRIDTGQTVWLVSRSWKSFCGVMNYSVGWSADSCGRLTEVWPDTKLCQFDLP